MKHHCMTNFIADLLKDKRWLFITLFSVISISLLFFMSFNSYNFADDYGHKANFRENPWSIFQNLIDLYFHHDGRGLSFQVAFAWFMAGAFPVQLVISLWVLLHLANAYILLWVLTQNLNLMKSQLISLALFFAILSWVGMKNNIGYNLFWATGGYTVLTAFLALMAIMFFVYKVENKNRFHFYLKLLLFLEVGMSSQNLSFALGALFTLCILWQGYQKDFLHFRVRLYYLSFFLIGFLVVFGAPGTWQRMADNDASFGLLAILKNYMYLLYFYLFINKVQIFFSIVLGGLVVVLTKHKNVYFYNIHKSLEFLILMILMFAVVLPFAAMPAMPFVKRAGYFFSFFISGISFLTGLVCVHYFSTRFRIFNYLKQGIYCATLISIMYVSYNFYIQVPLYLYLKDQVIAREEYILAKKREGLTRIQVKRIDVPVALFTGRFEAVK